MEPLITGILGAAPWAAPLLYLIFRQQQRIDLLEGRQDRMMTWLLDHVDLDDETAAQLESDRS